MCICQICRGQKLEVRTTANGPALYHYGQLRKIPPRYISLNSSNQLLAVAKKKFFLHQVASCDTKQQFSSYNHMELRIVIFGQTLTKAPKSVVKLRASTSEVSACGRPLGKTHLIATTQFVCTGRCKFHSLNFRVILQNILSKNLL